MKNIIYEDLVEVKDLPGRTLKWLITPQQQITSRFSMNSVVIKPGSTVKPAHSHPNMEEVIYIISGNGRVFIDNTVSELREGAVVLFKPGSVHMVRNDGDVDMKVLCFFTPPATLDDYKYFEEIQFPE